jgi:hypothetical protein
VNWHFNHFKSQLVLLLPPGMYFWMLRLLTAILDGILPLFFGSSQSFQG